MSGFEKFVFKKGQHKKPRISINNRGIFVLSVSFVREYARNFKYAILFYDRERCLVGMRFNNKKDGSFYKVIYNRANKTASIAGVAFMNYYGIPKGVVIKREAKWDSDNNMVIIDINKEPKEATCQEKKKKKKTS